DHTLVLETGRSGAVWAVAFHPDGAHLFGGGDDGILRWRLADGQEVRKQTGTRDLGAISVSKDQKWIVCGTVRGASVWDAKIQEKVVDVEGTGPVLAVDISGDSTRFATGTAEASIWSLITGKKSVAIGALQHDDDVTGIKFSPSGQHIATACYGGSISIFDSHSGNGIITINTTLPLSAPATPLAWSRDGRQIFAASHNRKIKSFDVSSGSQLVESDIPNDVRSIALAGNGKFIATFADRTISFLDASTLGPIGTVVQDSQRIDSIALSQDNNYLATGCDRRVIIRNLGNILPDMYGPFHVS
ncbi:WD40-repeat-containing domain protein, partial [Butyriboletus roseoflavus]